VPAAWEALQTLAAPAAAAAAAPSGGLGGVRGPGATGPGVSAIVSRRRAARAAAAGVNAPETPAGGFRTPQAALPAGGGGDAGMWTPLPAWSCSRRASAPGRPCGAKASPLGRCSLLLLGRVCGGHCRGVHGRARDSTPAEKRARL